MDIILKSSPAGARKLQAIIAQGPRPTEVKFHKSEPAPQELLSLPQESSKGSEYNGMHKLFLISETEGEGEEAQTTNYIYIADGATFDSKTGESAASRVEVNGISFDLQPQKFTLENHSVYVYAVFSAATPTSEASVSYGVGAELPKNDATDKYYYLIGRVLLKDGTFSVHQDHENKTANGIIVILWSKCYE